MLEARRLADLESFVIDLNRASAEVILPLFRADHGLEDKGGERGFDPVTEADRGAEAAIRKLIAARFPDHGVVGEEYGRDREDAEFVWVLDPVDGTRAFIAGLPVWTTLISLRHEGRPVLGSIGQPYIDEIFVGHAGGSRLVSRSGERALRTRTGAQLSQAIVHSTDPSAYFETAERAVWRELVQRTRLARLGCDAYAYAMVAAGTMDLVVESRVCKCWDIEVAVPLITGAGGAVSDWEGRDIGLGGGQIAMAGDRALLDAAVEILREGAMPPG
jgi:histidinol phosphatase-like enzyme (inositol monophosphatase family)